MTQEELRVSFEKNWDDLAKAIDQAMGHHISTSTGFTALSNEVLRRTGKHISASTIKRIYGYIPNHSEARESTLDILSLFAGFGTWQQFCTAQQTVAVEAPGSGFVNARKIDVAELPLNTVVRLRWAPERLAACLYRGDYTFEVLRSEKTRLVQGTIFKCFTILSGESMMLDNVLIGGVGTPVTYSIGLNYGVQFDLIIP